MDAYNEVREIVQDEELGTSGTSGSKFVVSGLILLGM